MRPLVTSRETHPRGAPAGTVLWTPASWPYMATVGIDRRPLDTIKRREWAHGPYLHLQHSKIHVRAALLQAPRVDRRTLWSRHQGVAVPPCPQASSAAGPPEASKLVHAVHVRDAMFQRRALMAWRVDMASPWLRYSGPRPAAVPQDAPTAGHLGTRDSSVPLCGAGSAPRSAPARHRGSVWRALGHVTLGGGGLSYPTAPLAAGPWG